MRSLRTVNTRKLHYSIFLISVIIFVLFILQLALIVITNLKKELIKKSETTYQLIADDHESDQIPLHDELTSKKQFNKYGEEIKSDPLCLRTCSNPRYQRYPLLVISLDGFAQKYIERNIVKTLHRFTKCGASAKWMYASYPTKTFPNHYTMATGLYPEAHGIIDNDIYDPALSSDLVDTRRTSDSRYFKAEKYNITTACLFWAGCSVDFEGIQPKYNLPYDSAMDVKTQITKLMNWLKLPEISRPMLLMAYIKQPDFIGHFQQSEEQKSYFVRLQLSPYLHCYSCHFKVDVTSASLPASRLSGEGEEPGYSGEPKLNEVLNNLDDALDYLLESLHRNNMLGCLNILIVSDHGMQKLNRIFYMDQILDTKGMIVSSSVVSRIQLVNSTLNKDDVVDYFRCNNNGNVYRVYDEKHIPKRYHYEASNRIGDIIIEGQPGTAFYATRDNDIGVVADHGYDYITPNMRTIFYAAGPSIVTAKVIEPFQNVEIYNLIADLIGIPERASNNGTHGRLHEILMNLSSASVNSSSNEIENCSSTLPSPKLAVIACNISCKNEEDTLTHSLSNCFHNTPKGHLGYSDKNIPYCYVGFCSATAIFRQRLRHFDQPKIVYEMLTSNEFSKKLETNEIAGNCWYIHSQFNSSRSYWDSKGKGNVADNQLTLTSLLLNPASQYRDFAELLMQVYRTFNDGALENLRKTVFNYVMKYERLIAISGTVNDFDHDGHADSLDFTAERKNFSNSFNKSKLPTHIFVVLIRCENMNWSDDGHSCKNASETRVLSFLLPNLPDDLNCLDPVEYLGVNTARIRDIELLTGLEFFTSRSHYPVHIALQLRTYIPDKLWPVL